jgi:endonuclease/exonuclease/phosphatase family metal-dependent hydrolase
MAEYLNRRRLASWLSLPLARAAFVLACATGCATARNYDDPAGPILVGPQPMAGRLSSDLRVVTFNLKFAKHPDRAADLLSRPGPLRDADVLVLQEMDQPGAEVLARALGMSYVYVPAAVHPSSRRDFGVAILSPWALESPGKVPLPHLHRFRKMRRVAAVATVRTPTETLRVFAVHFETPFGASDRARRDQARTVAADAAAWTGPVIVAGDFNGTGGARELARLGFDWLTRDVHNTWGPFDVDHILVRGLCAAGQPSAAKAPDPTHASDHMPVWATVQRCGNPRESYEFEPAFGRFMRPSSQRSKSHNWVSLVE